MSPPSLRAFLLDWPDRQAEGLWIILIEAALLPSLAVTLVLLLVGPPQRPEVSP